MADENKVDSVFTDFTKNETVINKLREALQAIRQGWQKMNVCLLKIRECDARSCESFSRATCDTIPHKFDKTFAGDVLSYTIGSIFQRCCLWCRTTHRQRFFDDGVDVLENYLNEDGPKIPCDKPSQEALKKLLISFSKTMMTKPEDDVDELDLAVDVAQHLLANLAVGSQYKLDRHYKRSQEDGEDKLVCPCGQKDEKILGRFGDTSFGCSQAWHGETDILMEDLLPVTISKEDSGGRARGPSKSSDSGNESTEEVTESDGFAADDFKCMMSQCIVYSYLQRKQTESLSNYLIPSVGISKRCIMVHFYDCENDILLGTAPIPLFVTERLSIYPIVLLWLTLNYKSFCSGVIEDMMEYKAEFVERTGAFIELYRNNVAKPCHVQTEEQDFSWAEECGILQENNKKVKLSFVKIGK